MKININTLYNNFCNLCKFFTKSKSKLFRIYSVKSVNRNVDYKLKTDSREKLLEEISKP